MNDKLLGFIDMKIGLGSILVMATQAVFWIAYVTLGLTQLKDIKSTVDNLQATMNAVVAAAPVQSERVIEMGRRLDGLDRAAGDLGGRVGQLEQKGVGFRSDLDQFRAQLQSLQSASDAPIRKPRN